MRSVQIAGGYSLDGDLEVRIKVGDAPSVTLTPGLSAQHRAIVGNQIRLALDQNLAHSVTGGPLVHPPLVWA
jgi:hypothetical protein